MVADGLSALGLYITAIQQGAARPRRGAPAGPGALRPGAVGRARSPRKRCARPAPSRRSTSTCSKQKVQALYEDWKEAPGGRGRRRSSSAPSTTCKRDAAVIADAEVARQSDEALAAIHGRDRPEPDRRLPRDPGARAREAARDARAAGGAARRRARRGDRPGAARDLPRGGDGGRARRSREHLATCRDAPHDREVAHHDPPRLPHAEGQRPHGRPHRPGRGRLAVRAGDEQVAEGREAGHAGPARLHRRSRERSFAGWIGELKAGGERDRRRGDRAVAPRR